MTQLSRQTTVPDQPLRVALDTGFLALPPSGTGSYVAGLQSALERREDVSLAAVHPPDWLRRLGSRAMRLAWDDLLVEVWRMKHASDADLLHVPSFSAPVISRAPLIVTVHDVIPLVLPAYRASRTMRLYLELMRRATGRSQMVLTPSDTAAMDVCRVLGIPEARIRVIPLAADPAFRPPEDPQIVRQELRERLGIEGRYLLTVAGFDRRKNVPLLVEAFARARPSLPDDVALVVAGAPHSANPAVFPPVEPVIDRLGVGDRVVLVGRVSADERLLLYQGAHGYVTPSVYEGFGLTPLEAMASGVPVIAANRTSLPEVVGDAGLLVEPEVDAVAEALVALVGDGRLHADLRARGLARSRQFSWARTAELTVAAYREALAQADCSRPTKAVSS